MAVTMLMRWPQARDHRSSRRVISGVPDAADLLHLAFEKNVIGYDFGAEMPRASASARAAPTCQAASLSSRSQSSSPI